MGTGWVSSCALEVRRTLPRGQCGPRGDPQGPPALPPSWRGRRDAAGPQLAGSSPGLGGARAARRVQPRLRCRVERRASLAAGGRGGVRAQAQAEGRR
eukprot:8434811-Alexandrium_andersonii.AAC.1